MFHSSTQREHWTFKNEEELREIRKKTNGSFCSQQQEAGTSLLDAEEEFQLFRYYQKKLVELCNLFAPPKWVPLPRTALVRVYATLLVSTSLSVIYIYTDNCGDLLQEILPTHFSDGVSPTRHVVCSSVQLSAPTHHACLFAASVVRFWLSR